MFFSSKDDDEDDDDDDDDSDVTSDATADKKAKLSITKDELGCRRSIEMTIELICVVGG